MSFSNAKILCPKLADSAAYHSQSAERGTAPFVMSSGALREFASCPNRWKAGYESPESEARTWGSLLDCLVTTPAQFDARYGTTPETYTNEKGEVKDWNNNAKVCRQWHAEHGGIEIVSRKLLEAATVARDRLRQDEIIRGFIDASECQCWVTAEWADKATGLVVPCKALLDLVPRLGTAFDRCLGDLKTTRSAAVMPWQRWCFTAGYHVQAAFYLDMYVAATGEDRNTWCFIVQENYEPYQPGKRMLSEDFLKLGRATYRKMLENYCQCLKNNTWPGYDDTDEAIQGWSLVEPEPFMAERAQFAPKYEFGEDEGDESVAVNIDEIVP